MLRNPSLVGALVFLCTILSAGTPQRVDAGNLVPAPSVAAQQINSVPPQTAQITQTIDNSIRQQLVGNTDSALLSGIDLGAVADSLPLDHLWLQLRRSPESEQALEQRIDEMHDANSPNFHQWLTAEQIGTWYGPAQQDINTVSAWLESQGFTVNGVFTSGMLIDFSGTAGIVQAAFGTQLHNYTVGGTTYLSNASDPSIPAALAPVVVGVVSLNDRFPHPLMHKRNEAANNPSAGMGKVLPAIPDFTFTDPTNGTFYAIAPGDFNTIYNVGPAWAKGIRGAGQTIVVIEDTNIKNVTDVTTFRTAFGLSTGFTGTFTQVHPTGATTCANPGVNGAEGEAALDAEWAGVAAPDAAIVLASCADSATVFGGLIASQNLINGASPPTIMSVSYGFCESQNGATANQSYVTAWQQAAAEGITVFVSSGDEGAASCDANKTRATHGIAVSGFTSTPYNVSVGGTDFVDTYNSLTGGPALSIYWGASNNGTFASALSYIPEIPWNDSCASQLLYTLEGYTRAYGPGPKPLGFCNTADGTPFRTTASGSGGPSNFSAKPSWQTGVVGIVADGKRDIPDVSLFSANGLWSHFLVYCLTDAAQGGTTCDYTNSTDTLALAAGGTSFAAPALAGIQALINQSSGQSWGNMNTQYYSLAATEYGNSTTLSSCNSSNGNAVGSSCIFYDITQGDIDVNCTGPNCFGATGTTVQGILSTSTITAQPAYAATAGWDFATGLGTVNVANLVAALTPTPTFTIGGNISSLTGSVQLKLDGTSPTSTQTQTFSANGGFTFTTALNSGSNWTVSVAVQPTGQTCTVTNGTGTNLTANVTTVAVACTTNTFTIGGTIGGLVGSVGLKVDGTSPTSTQTQTFSANGGFTFTTPLNSGSNWTVSVATQPTGQTCVVTSGTGTNLTANVTTVAVACTTNTFTIGGTIGGLVGSVGLKVDGTSPTSTQTQTFSANGGFTFTTPLNSGSNWTVSVATQPTGQTCVVTSGTGTNLLANVTTVAVACTVNTFTLTYTADANGTITGTTTQIVNFGANGSAVTAAPNTGYHFVQWSDASTANPRTDNNVTANITVNASFAPNTLVFTTQPGDVARGQTLATVVVTEQDGSGNTVLDNTSSVDFTIAACGGAVDLGNVAMINGVATLTSSEPFYTPTSTPGLQISAATGVLTGSSQFFNVLPNSDLLFVDGFEACRL